MEWKGNIINIKKRETSNKWDIIKIYKIRQIYTSPVFESPEKGVHEIIGGRMNKVQNAKSLNFFPNQATETVRLEEALLGTLAIINAQS